jgi:CheY-like chemotaxis protein
VRLARVESHIDVSVSDTGLGIAPEFLPHIFERFRQADQGMNRERGGLGLGLAIARQLVEMHGGTIEAISEGTGKGSTFRIKIPLMIVHAPAKPDARGPSHASSEKLSLPDLSGLLVLAVDDDRDARLLIGEILEVAGARVLTAASAAEALAILEKETPDVLVADLGMPQVDGLQFIGRVRQHQEARIRDVPAAALTAFARSEDRTKALRAGFHVHLSKPIDPAELVTTVAMLGRHFAPG